MDSITIPQKDKGYNISFTVQYANAAVVNLSGYTVNMKVWTPGTPGTLLTNNVCTITDANTGACVYTLLSGDFNTTGIYYGELEVLKTGIVESTQAFKIIVTESG